MNVHAHASLVLPALLLWLAACDRPTAPVDANERPNADAGADRTVQAGQVVRLDGRGSFDAEGDELGFAWIQISGPVAVGIAEASTERASTVLETAGEYRFRLVVTDPQGLSAIDEVVVAAEAVPDLPEPANRAPVAVAGVAVGVQPGELVVLDGSSSSDADGDDLLYDWVLASGPEAVDIANAAERRAFVAPAAPGEYVFRLRVTDLDGAFAETQMRVTVTAPPIDEPEIPNLPPSARVAVEVSALEGEAAVLDGGESSDPEGEALLFAWVQTAGPLALPIGAADTPVATVVPAEAGEYVFRLIVTDVEGATAFTDITLLVSALQPAATPDDGGTDSPDPGDDGDSGTDDPDDELDESGQVEIVGTFAPPVEEGE